MIDDQQDLITVRDLVVRYRTGRSMAGRAKFHTAVDGVTFSIKQRQTFGLVGESGSGKSTIGRAILRLVPKHSGTIHFNGTEIDEWGSRTPRRYRQAVQAVFQDPSTSMNPRMTVGQSLSESLGFHTKLRGPERSHRLRRLLDDVGLAGHHASRYPHELSGGQQQRVAIARALAPSPQLVICDEAVSALDVSTQSQVINLLKDLQEEYGMSYLFISHDLSVVRQVSDHLAVLHFGRLVEQGDVEAIYENPSDPYTRKLLESIPRMPAVN